MRVSALQEQTEQNRTRAFCQDSNYLPPLNLVLQPPCSRVRTAAALHRSKEQLPEPTDELQSTSQGIMPLINQPSMFCCMNYWSDLHFVCEGWWRGLASSQDHDDEDSDEEEGENRAHDSSGHGDGVWPLRLRLVWDRVEIHFQHMNTITSVQGTESKACCKWGECRAFVIQMFILSCIKGVR